MRWVRSWSGRSERLEGGAYTWGVIRPDGDRWAWQTTVPCGEHASGTAPTKAAARERVEKASDGGEGRDW